MKGEFTKSWAEYDEYQRIHGCDAANAMRHRDVRDSIAGRRLRPRRFFFGWKYVPLPEAEVLRLAKSNEYAYFKSQGYTFAEICRKVRYHHQVPYDDHERDSRLSIYWSRVKQIPRFVLSGWVSR